MPLLHRSPRSSYVCQVMIALQEKGLINTVTTVRTQVEAMDRAAASGDEQSLGGHDLAFHLCICNLSSNHQMRHAFQKIQAERQMLVTMAEQRFEPMQEAAAEHGSVVEAIAGRDLARASAALRKHILASWRRLAEAYEGPDGTLTRNLKQY